MSRTILVVEDDPLVREVIATTLRLEGFALREAGDGFEALQVLREGVRPSLIILDLKMEPMDGVTFLRHVRANPAWAPLPVLILTAWADAEIRHDPILDGLTVLQKPFLQLAAAVRTELGETDGA